MITSELVQAPGFLDVGERPIASPADAAITLTDATLNVLPSVSFVPSLTLPSALAMAGTPAGGKRYRFCDANGSAATYNITINAPGTTINGSATLVLAINWGVAVIEWNGTAWQVWALSQAPGGSTIPATPRSPC